MRVTGKVFIVAAVAILASSGAFAQPAVLNQNFVAPIPLGSHPQGQEIVSNAVRNTPLADFQWKFLDETYSNHVYATDPFGNKYKLSCLSLKATGGFGFKMPAPTFHLDPSGLTVTQRIDRIAANGLRVKFQVGPCVEHTVAFGFQVSDVKFTWKTVPIVTIKDGGVCELGFRSNGNSSQVTIGDVNIYSTPNELDKLAKDAVREGVNLLLEGDYDRFLRRELTKQMASVCGAVGRR